MATKPAIPCLTRGWSSTARIRIELVSALMIPSLSAALFRRASQITTTGGKRSHKPRLRGCSTQPPYPHQDHSRPPASPPQVRRVLAYRAARNALHDSHHLESLDQCPFRHHGLSIATRAHHIESRLQCDSLVRAEMHCATLQLRFGTLHLAQWDGAPVGFLRLPHLRQERFGWFRRLQALPQPSESRREDR